MSNRVWVCKKFIGQCFPSDFLHWGFIWAEILLQCFMCLKNVADCPKHESGSSFLTLFWRSFLWESMFASGQGENGRDDTVNNGYTVLNAHTYSLCQVHKGHCSMDCLTTPVKLGLFLSPFYRQKNWGLERFDYPLAVQLMRGGRPWFWLHSLLPSFLSLLFLLPSLLPSLFPSVPLSFFLIAGDFIGKSCILVLRFIALCRHIYIFFFFWTNWRLAANLHQPSLSALFSQ